MEKFKSWFKQNQKKAYAIGGGIIVVLIIAGIAVSSSMSKTKIKVKKDLFVHEVNTELDQKASTYLDGVKDDQAKVDFAKIDTKKLGKYDGVIKYDGTDYTIKFEVKDTTKPVIKAKKTKFAFTLDTSLDDVNKAINKELTITDNYDMKFDALKVITELPTEEKEVVVKLSVKDTNGNKSDEVSITVQFTEDGTEKDNLNKEQKSNEVVTNTKENTGNSSNGGSGGSSNTNSNSGGSSNNGSNTGGNDTSNGSSKGDGGNTKPIPTPQPEPTPTPEPTPQPTPEPTPTPTPQPEPTPTPEPTPEPEPSYLCPNGVIDKMKPCEYYEIPNFGQSESHGPFNSQHDADVWSNNGMNTGGGYGKLGVHSVQVNDGTVLYFVLIWR